MSKRSPSPSSLPRREKKSYEEFLASSATTSSSQAEDAQKLDVGKTEATQLKVRAEAQLDVGNIQLPSTTASQPSQTVQTGLSSLAAACVITHPDAVVISNVTEDPEDSSVAPPSAGPAELYRTPTRITTTSEPGLSKNLDKEYVVYLEEEEGNFDVFCCPDVGDIEFPDVGNIEAVPHAPDSLYPGSPITVTESITSILAFAQSEDISGAGLGKLLNLINIHLPQPNNCMKTTHSFYKQLESADAKFKLDYYCSVCWKIRASPQDICDTCIDPTRKVDYFVSLPLGPQIAKLFSRPGFVDKLQYKHKRTKKNQSNFEDIYDGRLYKEAGTFLCNELSISLMWYTDGIALYECSSYSLWPFFFVINELPPEERFKRENILMGALWGCHEKPHPNIFLQRTCQEILALREGVEVNVHGQEKTSLVKGCLICGTCDVPAKAAFLNIKTYAGFFSCPKCLTVGEKSDESDDVMVFPHEESLELRTRENYDKHLEEVMASTTDSVAGIKGPTILDSMLTNFMFDFTSIDSLHCLYIGITKQIFRLLFDKTFKGQPFSLHLFSDKVNSRLLALQLPHFVQRVTLPVDKLYLWKGTLCRNVFFHMMLPVLNGIMADNYFQNIVDLVDGVSILNSDSISLEDITYAGLVLSRFCANFQQLYGKRHMSSNLHLLRHLHECVRDLCPLFFSSTFTFENLNGKLANLAHGTRHAGLQIAKHLNLFSDLDLKVSELPEGLPKSFCEKISKKSRLCISEKISENMFIVGNYDTAPNAFCDCIGNRLSVVFGEPCNFSTFSRAFYNKQLFVTSSYTRGSRVSSFIKCNDSGHVFLAEILSFVRVNMAFSQDVLVLLREIQVESFFVRHMKKVVGFAEPKLVALHDLVSVCFKILVDDCMYVSEPLNTFEME